MVIKIIKKNWWLLLIGLGCIFAYCTRERDIVTSVVSNSDSTVVFSTTDMCIEQTWQPYVKKIHSISVPYEVNQGFYSDVLLTVCSDDYEQELVKMIQSCEFVEKETGIIEFSFEPIDVVLGERYHICLDFQNVKNTGELSFMSGSNYDGCKIGGQQVNRALAIQVGASKTSALSWFLAVLFPLASIALVFMVIFERKWEETVGIAIVVESLLLYVFGLLGHTNWGIFAIYVVAAMAFAMVVYMINRKNIKIYELLSPGTFIFFFIFFLIILGNKGMWYGRFDEYSHWGLAVKDMYYYDSFAKHAHTTVLLPRYLPFITLIEYFYTYLNGIYAEHIVYAAFQMTMLSFMIIMCKPISEKKCLLFPLVGGMICIPSILFYDISSSIYVDPLLGILAVYVLICYYSGHDTVFSKVQIIFALIALVLTKDMGVVIGGLITFVLIADTIIKNMKNKRRIWSKQCFPIMCILVVLFTWVSWQIYMSIPVFTQSSMTAGGEADNIKYQGTVDASGISVDGLIKLLTGRGSDDQKQVIKNALVRAFDGDMYYVGNVGVSYMDLMLLCVLLSALLFLMKRYYQKEEDKLIQLTLLLAFFGAVYWAVMCIMYVFAFSIDEALKLKSFERYLGSFLIAVVMITYYFGVLELCDMVKEKWKKRCVMLMVVAVVFIITPMNNFVRKNQDYNIDADMVYWYDEVENIFRSFGKRGERVAFVCSNAGTESYFIFRNAVSPMITELKYLNIVSSDEIAQMQKEWYANEGDESSKDSELVTVEKWKAYLSNCQYLFVLHADDFFIESYKTVFIDPQTIQNGSIYRVDKIEGEVRLAYIGNTGVKKYK